jgi:CheY-like chemotaxis protein
VKRLLLVDDDALVTRAYRARLSAHGFQVNTAPDGAAAINLLRSAQPDLVVLDLMMPNLSGVEVLKFIRSQPRLAPTPVIILTNAYLNELGREAASIGIERALLKSQCSPSVLMSVIDELLEPKPAPAEEAAPTESSASGVDGSGTNVAAGTSDSGAGGASTAPPRDSAGSTPSAPSAARQSQSGEPAAEAVADLAARAPALSGEMRKLVQSLSRDARAGEAQQSCLREFYRKAHSLGAAAGLAGLTDLAQMATVFEALLYVLVERPDRLTPSVLRTLANLVDFIELLFQKGATAKAGPPTAPRALVVDDDPFSTRLIVSALTQAQIQTRGTETPTEAWDWLQKEPFDVLILDIEMPVLDGFELCKRFRALPGRAKTPVIFVTGHTDFQSRAQSTLSGGDDLIAKPILPMEMAAKVVMHLLKRRVRQ